MLAATSAGAETAGEDDRGDGVSAEGDRSDGDHSEGERSDGEQDQGDRGEGERSEDASADAPSIGADAREAQAPHGAFAEAPVASDDLPFRDTELRLSLEWVGMPDEGEPRMGLFGLNFDWHAGPYGYAGMGGYGAFMGERGGFFTGGFQGGAVVPIAEPVSARAGVFLGAGGGGAAAQGGGLMLRPHAGLEFDLDDGAGPISALAVNAAHVEFPNGGIRSTHVGLSVRSPWPVAIRSGRPESAERAGAAGSGAGPGEGAEDAAGSLRTMRFTGHSYLTLSGSRDTGGEPLETAVGTVGFEYRAHFTPRVFGVVEPRGSAFGGTDGFAEITVGGGYAMPLDPAEHLGLYASAGVGGAGGGRVETGGGLLLRASAGIDADVPGPLHFGLDVGALEAPTGSFRAFSTGVRLGIAARAIAEPGVRPDAQEDAGPVSMLGWRVRGGHSSYLDAAQKSGEEPRVDLLNLKIDHFLTESAYATGQAAGAYAGGSGGYASGLVGAGVESPALGGFRLFGEALVGAAGGGGVDVGQGLIVQPVAGANAELTDALGVELLGGVLLAPTGSTRSPVLEFGLSYDFSTPQVDGNR